MLMETNACSLASIDPSLCACYVLSGVVIEENAIVNRVIINNDIRISANKVVNNDPEKIALISEDM